MILETSGEYSHPVGKQSRRDAVAFEALMLSSGAGSIIWWRVLLGAAHIGPDCWLLSGLGVSWGAVKGEADACIFIHQS